MPGPQRSGPGARAARNGAGRLRWGVPLALILALSTGAGAEGSFQVRYYLPAAPWQDGLGVDGDWRGALGGGQFSVRGSYGGDARQSLGATYTAGTTTLYAQYDRTRTLLAGSSTLVVLAQRSFDAPGRGLRSLSSALVYTAGDASGSRYRVFSSDLGAGGAFSPQWTWTASAGGNLNDIDTDGGFRSRTLGLRARASAAGQWGGPRPATLNLTATADHQETLIQTQEDAPLPRPAPLDRFGVSVSGTLSPGDQDRLSAGARLDSRGAWSADVGLRSTRPGALLGGLVAEAALNVGGQANFGAPGTVSTPGTVPTLIPGWRAALNRGAGPWTAGLGYAGAGGPAPTHALDGTLSYAPVGGPNVQAAFGVSWQRQPDTSDAALREVWRPTSRASLGLGLQGGRWTGQVQASLNAAPYPGPDGTYSTRLGGGLSGSLAYAQEPLTLNLSSSLNYVPYGPAPWTGDLGAQALYAVTERVQLSGNVRWRPGAANVWQAGLGLRVRF